MRRTSDFSGGVLPVRKRNGGSRMYKEYRDLKVVEQSGYKYKPTPTITLKGQWLSELGFESGSQVRVKCEGGRLIITLANEVCDEK